MTTIKLFCAITVKNGERVPIEVNSEASSSQLRQEVSRATKIPLADLRLIFRGKMIKDDASPAVTAYKLENENVLHCMGKPSEGDPAQSPTPAVAPTSISNSTAAAAFPSIPAASASVSASATAVDPLQSALTTLRSSNPPQVYSTAVTTLAKVLSNIADHPMEDKYRKVKKGNAAFNKKLGGLNGGDAAMRAVGFVLEVQDGAEVYQLHASAEAWPKLMAAKASIEAAAAEAKRALDSPVPPMGGANPLFPPTAGAGMPGIMGSIPPAAAAALNNPMAQSAMTEMMRNPEMMRNMLQVSRFGVLFLDEFFEKFTSSKFCHSQESHGATNDAK